MYGYQKPSSQNHPFINRNSAVLHLVIQYIIIIIIQYYVQRI